MSFPLTMVIWDRTLAVPFMYSPWQTIKIFSSGQPEILVIFSRSSVMYCGRIPRDVGWSIANITFEYKN